MLAGGDIASNVGEFCKGMIVVRLGGRQPGVGYMAVTAGSSLYDSLI
jgi:hypothetical protein